MAKAKRKQPPRDSRGRFIAQKKRSVKRSTRRKRRTVKRDSRGRFISVSRAQQEQGIKTARRIAERSGRRRIPRRLIDALPVDVVEDLFPDLEDSELYE